MEDEITYKEAMQGVEHGERLMTFREKVKYLQALKSIEALSYMDSYIGVEPLEEPEQSIKSYIDKIINELPPDQCVICHRAIEQPSTGRKRDTCSEACRKRKSRKKRKMEVS